LSALDTVNKGLNDKQCALLSGVLLGRDLSEIWESAGYANLSAAESSLRSSVMTKALHDALQHRIKTVLAPKAVSRLTKIIENDKATDKTHLDAAKLILPLADFVAPTSGKPGDLLDKNPVDMSNDELAKAIHIADQAKRIAADRASPVIEVDSPDVSARSSQAADFLK